MAKLVSFFALYFVELANVAKAFANQQMYNQAYAGARNTQIGINEPVGKEFDVAVLAMFLKQASVPFSTAQAIDGVTFKLFENTEAYFRVFVSARACYAGMIGMSGKARVMLEACTPNVNYSWVKQGSKNYFYTANTEPVLATLVRM